MRFGFSPTQAGARFDAMCAQASLAETLGFDVIWAHEHHSGGSTYPSPLMTLAALAGVTKRIELGTLMNFGGPELEAVERSMRLFSEKVMPRLNG